MKIVKREFCVGFGLWQNVPQGRMHPTTHAERVIAAALEAKRASRGEPVSIRTTYELPGLDGAVTHRMTISKF